MNIKMPEHNSSIPLFIDIPEGYNSNIDISDVVCGADNNYYNNIFSLGKLTNNLYVLEDVGDYDVNTNAKCKLRISGNYCTENNEIFNVTRTYEYSTETESETANYYNVLYSERLGCTKVIFIPSNADTKDLRFFIKWVNRVPPMYEEVNTDIDNNQSTIKFYSQTSSKIYESLIVNISTSINSQEQYNNYSIGDNFIHIKNTDIKFNEITVTCDIDNNDTDKLRAQILNISGPTLGCGVGTQEVSRNYWGYLYLVQCPAKKWMVIKIVNPDRPSYCRTYSYYSITDKQGHKTYYLDGTKYLGLNSKTDDGKIFIVDNPIKGNLNYNSFSIYIPSFYNVMSVKTNVDNIEYNEYIEEIINNLDGQKYYKFELNKNADTATIILV